MGGVVSGIGSALGGHMQAQAVKSAASKQAAAFGAAEETIRQAVEQARQDILTSLPPAMDDYVNQVQNQKDLLLRGETDALSIMRQTSAAADSMLAQSGADVQKLIMGAAATQRGIPRELFERQYAAQAQPAGAPPGAPPIGTQQAGLGGIAEPSPVQPQAAGVQAGALPGTTQTAVTPGAAIAETLAPLTAESAMFSGVGLADVTGQGPEGAFITPPEKAAVQGVPGTGYAQTRADLEGSRDISRFGIEAGRTAALGQLGRGEQFLTDAERRGLAATQTFTDAGREAATREAALSGALGPEAQQEAIDAFIESPGQAYYRQQQEKALLRSGAATGGLGGGRVLTALQEQAMGIAAGQQQQQLANLGTIAQRGAGLAAGEQGLIGQTGAGLAGLAGMAAGVETQTAQDLMRIESLYGPQLAQYAMQTGLRLADVQNMTDQQRVGLLQQVGAGTQAIRAGTLQDLSNLAGGLGSTQLNQANLQGQLLANLATRNAAQTAQMQAAQGGAQAAGIVGSGQAMGQAVGGIGSALGSAWNQYGQNVNVGGFFGGGAGAGMPSQVQGGSAPITNPYTGQIQGGM